MESWKDFFNVTDRGNSGNVVLWGDTSKLSLIPDGLFKSGTLAIDDETADCYSYSQTKKVWTMI